MRRPSSAIYLIASVLHVTLACSGPRGTEVGNGAKPDRPTGSSELPGPSGDVPENGTSPEILGQSDVPLLLLASHCHSMIAPSRTGMPQLAPYTVRNSLKVVKSRSNFETRSISWDSSPGNLKPTLGGVVIQRELDEKFTRCLGEESISFSTTAVTTGRIATLETRISLGQGLFTLRLQRQEVDGNSELIKVELSEQNGYLIEWQVE